MGPRTVLMLAAAALSSALAAQQAPRGPVPEVVLSDATGGLPVADLGLGEGGVSSQRGALRFAGQDGCWTPGGVRVICRGVGVKLTFPSGRELLVGLDGALHLRDGEVAGRFPAGVELLLGDDSRVQVSLAQSRKHRLREVSVVHGSRALQPWRRGGAATVLGRARQWAGIRLVCCGDGGDLYRPIALGPLVVLDRVLCAEDRRELAPRERLVVLTAPLQRSLARMPKQHRETQYNVRRAVAAVTAVAERSDVILPAGAALRRAERDRLRWSLPGDFELELGLDGPLAPRLELFVGRSLAPMVEWTLGAAGAAYLANPNPEQLGKRWHGNGTRMEPAVPLLQARPHLQERQHALAVLRRLTRGAR